MDRTKKVPTPTKSTKKKASQKPRLRRLATSDMRHLPKPRAGFDAYVEDLIALAEKYGDKAGKSSVDLAAMRAALESWRELGVAREAAAAQLALLDNTLLADSSSMWTQMMVIYGHGRISERTDADLRAELQPFENFMKKPHRPKSTPVTTAPTTTAAT